MDTEPILRVEGAEALDFARDNECLVNLDRDGETFWNVDPDRAEHVVRDVPGTVVWIEGPDA
jgi:hypothetical protein